MKPRHVSFTLTAHEHVARERAWWLENPDHPEVFAEELEQALKVVALLPGAGAIYPASPTAGVRRVYLRRVGLHLYYTHAFAAKSGKTSVNASVFGSIWVSWRAPRERGNVPTGRACIRRPALGTRKSFRLLS